VTAAELLAHVFPWEVAPGVACDDEPVTQCRDCGAPRRWALAEGRYESTCTRCDTRGGGRKLQPIAPAGKASPLRTPHPIGPFFGSDG
jgi:hypothetical protein